MLPAVAVPTLVLHYTGRDLPDRATRYIVARIPDARLVELPASITSRGKGDTDRSVGKIEEFLTVVREHSRSNRMLAALVFTDLVDSTPRAVELGDDKWQRVMTRHDELVRRQLQRFDGRAVKHPGDGFLMPGETGLDARAGIHTGEVEVIGSDLRGLAVHVAARVGALAGPRQVPVSNMVKELVLGSGIGFEDRGTHTLRGVPDQWRLHAVLTDST